MSRVLIYTDFDGTVTGVSGNNTVFTPFYQSLLDGYIEGRTQRDYKTIPMKDELTVHQLFVQKFGVYSDSFDFSQDSASMLMRPQAVSFLHTLLANEEVTIVIVSKNRTEYINALFRYQNFSDDEISKLTVLDSGFKRIDVEQHIGAAHLAACVYILDDSHDDCMEMKGGALCSYPAENIKAYNRLPGTFEWDVYLQDILKITEPESCMEPIENVAVAEQIVLNLSGANAFSENVLAEQLQEPIEYLPIPQPTELSSPLFSGNGLLITGSFAVVGLLISLLYGCMLLSAGVLNPLSLFILVVSATVLTGSIGFGVNHIIESNPVITEDRNPHVEGSHLQLQHLGHSVTLNVSDSNIVFHYPSVLQTDQVHEDAHDELMTSEMRLQC